MRTDFTHYAGQVVRDNPALGIGALVPTTPLVMSGAELWRLVEDAFQHGCVHHAAVTRQLVEMAQRDAEAKARAQAEGPASLKPHFDDLFGERQAG